MNWQLSSDAAVILAALALLLGAVLVITVVLAFYALWWVRRIDLPPYAGFLEALRATPLIVVVILDLLDLTLDIFSAPLTWFLLGRLGLAPLRSVAIVKDLIPFTNFIPLMTLSWVFARFMTNDQGVPTFEHIRRFRTHERSVPIKTIRSKE